MRPFFVRSKEVLRKFSCYLNVAPIPRPKKEYELREERVVIESNGQKYKILCNCVVTDKYLKKTWKYSRDIKMYRKKT